jgi:hypothetical protein
MSGDRQRYVSYLLRLWRTQDGEALVWRASLESARSGERRGFARLSELYAFLEQVTAPVDEEEPRTPAGDDVDV